MNRWFLNYGFKQCEIEPCLYFYNHDGEFAIVLLYGDDILCATKNVGFKERVFKKLDDDYGLKDQGVLLLVVTNSVLVSILWKRFPESHAWRRFECMLQCASC